jgi:hypothetical protein
MSMDNARELRWCKYNPLEDGEEIGCFGRLVGSRAGPEGGGSRRDAA